VVVCSLLVTFGWVYQSRAQESVSDVSIQNAPAFTAETLNALPTDGWPTNGGNLFNQRHSPLAEINRDNVGGLRADWRTHLDASGAGARYSGEAQPIVHEGVVYIVTGDNDVFAISVDTGRIIWKYQAHLDQSINSVCCGWLSRGLGLGEGKVFVGQLDGRLVAVDQQTGDVAWAVQAERWQEGFSITAAPLYYNGLVIQGFAGGDRATRGRIKAYDAEDGSLVWTYYTIPEPGEFGSDTWPQDTDAWMYGGGAIWQTPAVDSDLGLIYFFTANASPDFNGSVREGDNLFTASVIALDAATGEYRWHFQTVHHDLWDYDGANPIVLFDLEIDGQERQGLAAIGKTGWVYILDRNNGEPLVGIEERAVPQEPRQFTSATQPYPIGDPFSPQEIEIAPEGYELVNQGRIFTPFWEDPVVMKPRGANWPPSSYDPETGLLYVCAVDRIMALAARPVTGPPEPGAAQMGGPFSVVDIPTTGIFAAMDMTTNQIAWRQRWSDTCYSGSVTTRGGLVFVGRNDGRFTALDSSSGEMLWQFQTGAGVNASASVFEHEGTEHVVVYSAGNLFAGSPRGDSVWMFSLDGTMGPVAPPAANAGGRGGAPPATVPGEPQTVDLVAGRQTYVEACVFCHGDQGEGGQDGIPLDGAISAAANRTTITNGRNSMPSFGNLLTSRQIQDVAAYLAEGFDR
jgi:alcohol dehydrogenase (cytochrome c)